MISVFLFIVTFIVSLPLLARGYFPMHDDLQAMRLFQLDKCFLDGQIPCRFVPDMAYGYGQALFNFYSAFPYYLGHIIRILFQFSIIDTVKILFIISLAGSVVGMYLLAKEFFGKYGGLLSAVLYLYAPYRAVNVYVRGALAEAFSLMLLPFLWLFIYKTVKNPSYKHTFLLALVGAAVLSTHNLSTMMYVPFTVLWVLYWLYKHFNFKSFLALTISGVLGFGLAAFFILPVFLEKHLIQDEVFTSDYSFYAAHFVSLKQLFVDRFWDYGGSIFGTNDHMSFQVGWPHWWLAVVAGPMALITFLRTKKTELLLPVFVFTMGLFAIFLAHQKSYLIWEAVPALSFVQFPWRFLGPGVFLISLAGGSVTLFDFKLVKYVAVFIPMILAIILNVNYFKPFMHFYDETDQTKLSGELFFMQQQAAHRDYLPKTVSFPPSGLAPDKPYAINGIAEIPNFTKTSKTFFFDANVSETAEIDIPIIYFPDWEVYILENQGILLSSEPGGLHGTIRVVLPPGKHMVYGRFVNTPVRTVANAISVVSLFILGMGAIITFNNKKFLGLQ